MALAGVSTHKKDLPTDEFSCGYCLDSLLSMTDPRELPCSHVCCLSCLQLADDLKDGKLTCPKCRLVSRRVPLLLVSFGNLSTRAEVAVLK